MCTCVCVLYPVHVSIIREVPFLDPMTPSGRLTRPPAMGTVPTPGPCLPHEGPGHGPCRCTH